MNILINYADIEFKNAQKRNSESGLKNGFDRVINYSKSDIDSVFFDKNEHILSQKRGAGYWLWKPYIILKTLNLSSVKEGDNVFYSDSGSIFINDVSPLLNLTNYEDIVLFFDGKTVGKNEFWLNKQWTKRDVFVFLDADNEDYYNNKTIVAAFQIYKKSEKSTSFLTKYIDLCYTSTLITDADNIYGKPNLIDFVEHRHDQAILGIFSKKENIELHKDPTQFGIDSVGLKNDNYNQIINHNRERD